jgi:hypothetical protein
MWGVIRDGIYRKVEDNRIRKRARVTGTKEEANGRRPSRQAIPASSAPLAPGIKSLLRLKRDITWKPTALALQSVATGDFKDMQGMAELIERTLFSETQYFARMWTLQEVCVSRIVQLAHGRGFIGLKEFFQVVFYLESQLAVKSIETSKALRLQ